MTGITDIRPRPAEEGTPMMRPICFDFPDDPACDYLDQQFMLGDSLLVSSVFDAAGVKATYVPAGAWTDFRSGAVLLVSEVDDRLDYSYAEGVTLRVFEVDAVATSEIVIPDPAAGAGARFALTRAEDSVLFEPVAGTGDRRVQFVGRQGASSVWEGVAESDPMGLIVEPTEGRVRWALSHFGQGIMCAE